MPEQYQKVAFVESGSAGIPDCFVRLVDAAAPTLVVIHGISRNAAEMATRFAWHPEFSGVNIIAPLFDRERFGKYQQLLLDSPSQTRSDAALFSLLDALGSSHGIDTQRVLLFGFSGGAQMAHRLAMLYPQRVRALCVVAAGWYLMPDPALPYPYGLKDGPAQADQPCTALSVPIRVMVGNHDRRTDPNVRMDPLIVTHQGTNRLRRARSWALALRQQARAQNIAHDVEMIVLQGGTHDFRQCVFEAGLIEKAAQALLPRPGSASAEQANEGIQE